MKNIITIPTYINVDGKFNMIGDTNYHISYLRGSKIHQLRIVVNGVISNNIINIVDHNSKSYKQQILQAISDYKNNKLNTHDKPRKFVKESTLKEFYSKKIVNNLLKHLLPIKTEKSRDKLTKYNLI